MQDSTLPIVRAQGEPSEELIRHFSKPLARIYANRGINNIEQLVKNSNKLAHFNALANINTAAQLISSCITEHKNIMIIGDFDADGATSVALCMGALKDLGAAHIDFLVPNRFDFGYGLSPEIVEVAAQRGAELLITVDNGIACFEGAKRAKSLGLQVVITDHHLPAESLPEADAIVNPNLNECAFPSKSLAGVGVAFYLMAAVKHALTAQNWFENQGIVSPNLANYLDLVALGTVADVVPLDSNNRILVHQGLQRIRAGRCRPGIQALLDVAGKDATTITASDMGFVLAPRLNAAGRLDDMTIGIQCLMEPQLAQARVLANTLDEFNQQRKQIEGDMQQEAEHILSELKQVHRSLPDGICLYQPTWHQGIIGILAGRIKETYFRPTVIFAKQDDTTLKGSARSIPGVHIRDVFEQLNTQFPGLIEKFGGHAMAAGLSIKHENIETFSAQFNLAIQQCLSPSMLSGNILSEGPLESEDYSLEFAKMLEDAGPWGQAFAEPIFDDVFELVDQRILGDKHLKVTLRHGDSLIEGIQFNIDPEKDRFVNHEHVHVAFKLNINRFRGQTRLQLLIEKMAELVG